MAKEHRIAVIPGDGIGREVMPEGVRVMEAAGAKHGISFQWKEFDWSCDWYKAHGKMCPDDAQQILRGYDAVYFGAVGNPAIVPDHVSAWGLLINFRRWFDLYVNLRPVRLFEGLPCPLAGRKPGDIDYYVIRENTEGEYGNVGGRMFEGTPNESRDAAVGVQPQGRGPDHEVRLRTGEDAQEARHLLHQVERHLDHHALLGRALRGDEEELPRHPHRPVPRRRPVHPDGAEPGPLRRRSWPPTCSATSFPTWAPPPRARSASRRRATSTRNAPRRPSSSRCTARRRTSPARRSPTRSARSGRAR